jgi:4'-phosphopantetheinyl transferase
MIYILYSFISENNHQKLLEDFLLKFSIDFQKKIISFRRWQDAQLSLLGRILLYKGAEKFNEKYNDSSIRYTDYNKPYFEDEELYFNISHSGEMVVCVVTDVCDIGIDVELLRDIQVEDFQRQMTEGEWHKISTSFNKIASFYNYWTQKEAVIKSSGKGLSIPLKSFEISENRTIVANEGLFLKEIKLDVKYKCHIATSILVNEADIKIKELDYSEYSINLI